MKKINTGGPAFPTPRYERGDMYSLGMTLRDYFAAKAMNGMFASSLIFNDATNDEIAMESYNIADAMLKARDAQT